MTRLRAKSGFANSQYKGSMIVEVVYLSRKKQDSFFLVIVNQEKYLLIIKLNREFF